MSFHQSLHSRSDAHTPAESNVAARFRRSCAAGLGGLFFFLSIPRCQISNSSLWLALVYSIQAIRSAKRVPVEISRGKFQVPQARSMWR